MKNKLLIGGLLVIAFALGVFFGPKKTEIKEVEKIVYKEKTDTKINSKRTIGKKEVIHPDGTRTIETISTIDRSTDKKTDTSVDAERSREEITESRPDWRLHVIHFPELIGYQDKSTTVDIQRRILSELYLGVSVNTQKQVGFSISIGF